MAIRRQLERSRMDNELNGLRFNTLIQPTRHSGREERFDGVSGRIVSYIEKPSRS